MGIFKKTIRKTQNLGAVFLKFPIASIAKTTRQYFDLLRFPIAILAKATRKYLLLRIVFLNIPIGINAKNGGKSILKN